jgi:monothiol glutaredoxin
MELSPALRAHLDSIVHGHRVVLFMKGTRYSPSCGFSASVVNLLDTLLTEYHTVDVLADPAVREGIKAYADWPTIPQLFLDGEFLGGADIVRAMHEDGSLAARLGVSADPRGAPTLHLTDGAARAFAEAAAGAEGLVLRMEVTARYAYDLYFGEAQPGDRVADCGALRVHLDPASALRAEGATIDYVVGSSGGGFRIDNPNEPAKVVGKSPAQVKAMRDAGERFELVDVRTPEEWEAASLDGARLLDHAYEHSLLAMDRATPLVFVCHHGVRSRQAAEHFARKGFRTVINLEGGIDAWSVTVDPTVPRY